MNGLLFGLNVSTSAAAGADPISEARAAESLGFDFVSMSDHPAGSHPTNETWTLLVWIAAATTRIGLVSRVLGVPFRHPPMLAKMAETLDRLSGGRLILGLGAGGSPEEIRALGLDVLSDGRQIERLEEAVQVIKGLWTQKKFSFEGAHYRTEGMEIEPKPRRIPIWLGTFGSRALSVTGRVGDGWIPTLGHVPAHALPGMRDRVLLAASQGGRRADEIRCVLNVEVRVDESAPASDDALHGGPERIATQLSEFIAQGFNGFNFIPVGPEPDHQRDRLAREVLSAFRPAT